MASTSSLLRAMTYNIRFDQLTPRPNFSILNWINLDLNPWLSRRLPFSDVINSKSPALLGIQEAKAWQANDLSCLTGLNWLGEGRDVSHSSTNNFYHTNVIQGVLLAAVVVAAARGTRITRISEPWPNKIAIATNPQVPALSS